MKLPPELERKCLELAGEPFITTTHHKRDPKDADLIVGTVEVGTKTLAANIPVDTRSEVNQRDFRARSRRGGQAWKAVSRVLGPELRWLAPFAEHYRDGGALLVTFTRLGGHKLDNSNLPTACKAVEDALAFLIGADDGDSRWHPSWTQKPGSGPRGVRIELERFE